MLVEKIRWIGEYPIDRDSPLQQEILEVSFRSKRFNDITTSTSLSKSKIDQYKDSQVKEKSLDAIKNDLYKILCSKGNENLKKKEELYEGAILKRQYTEKNLNFFKKENLKIESIRPKNPSAGSPYIVILRSTIDNLPGTGIGQSLDIAVKKAYLEIKEWQQKKEKHEKEMWKVEPEFMYIKGEYSDQLQELHLKIGDIRADKSKNIFLINAMPGMGSSLPRKNFKGEGSSWEEAFEDIIKKVNVETEEIETEKKRWLDVSSFSDKEINLIMDNYDNRADQYFDILTNKIDGALDKNQKLVMRN